MDPASCILYIFFLLCSAYFAACETAYTGVSKVRLRTLADKGNRRAVKALWICDRFDKTLTTILIGNNIFHAACASLSALLVLREFSEEYVTYGTLITTVIVYLFAEMLPKSLAKARSEEIALFFASSLQLFIRLLTPVSALFSVISRVLSRFFASEDSGTVTEEDLVNIIETIEDEGVLSPEKQALVNSAMEFREKLAEDIMIPIELVDVVSSSTPLKQLADTLRELSYSRVIEALERGDFYASTGAYIYSITKEGTTVKVKTSPASRIVLRSNSRFIKNVLDEKGDLTEATFTLPDENTGFRIIVTGKEGKAYSQFY